MMDLPLEIHQTNRYIYHICGAALAAAGGWHAGSLSAMAALIWLTQSSVAFVLDTPTVRYKVSEEQGCAAGTQH